MKAPATELAAGWKEGDEEKAIRAESAQTSALEMYTVELVKRSSTARLDRLNYVFTFLSFLQSLHQAQQQRLGVEDTRKQLQQRFGRAANPRFDWSLLTLLMVKRVPQSVPRTKPQMGTPLSKKGGGIGLPPPAVGQAGRCTRDRLASYCSQGQHMLQYSGRGRGGAETAPCQETGNH